MLNFLGPLIGLAGSLISGGQASSAANAASAGTSALTDAQRQVINTLLQTYGTTFQPLQESVGSVYKGFTGLPIDQTLRYVVANLLQPYINPAAEQQAREANLRGLGTNLDMLVSKLGPALTPGQLTGLATDYGETALENNAALNANIMATNTAQSNQQRLAAINLLLNSLGAGGQYSSIGSNLTGQAISGTQGLINTYAQEAGAAGGAAAGAYGAIPGIVKSFLSQQPQTPTGPGTAPFVSTGYIPTAPAENLVQPSTDTFPTYFPGNPN